ATTFAGLVCADGVPRDGRIGDGQEAVEVGFGTGAGNAAALAGGHSPDAAVAGAVVADGAVADGGRRSQRIHAAAIATAARAVASHIVGNRAVVDGRRAHDGGNAAAVSAEAIEGTGASPVIADDHVVEREC